MSRVAVCVALLLLILLSLDSRPKPQMPPAIIDHAAIKEMQ